jgi:hypothetical protein
MTWLVGILGVATCCGSVFVLYQTNKGSDQISANEIRYLKNLQAADKAASCVIFNDQRCHK